MYAYNVLLNEPEYYRAIEKNCCKKLDLTCVLYESLYHASFLSKIWHDGILLSVNRKASFWFLAYPNSFSGILLIIVC